jgi:hypothetical protein
MTATKWNPRYAAYALANNRTPEEQKAAEPGNCGYILWVTKALREYREENDLEEWAPLSNDDVDTWLWMHAEGERILAMSDEEILADCRARGEDPEVVAAETKAMLLAALDAACGPTEATV